MLNQQTPTINPNITLKEAVENNVTMKTLFQQFPRFAETFKGFADTPASTVYTHGRGGLFQPAAQREVFSALIGLQEGFEATLPLKKSFETSPSVYIITGIGEVDLDTPTTSDCGDYPAAAKIKRCQIGYYPFGSFGMESQSIDLRAAGRLADRGDFRDYIMNGTPFYPGSAKTLIPGSIGTANYSALMNNDGAKILAELAQSMNVAYGRDAIYANPANNTAVLQYYRGLDLLINNNYSDFVTGVACERVDSLVLDFETITGDSPANINTYSNEIVRAIVETLARLARRSQLMGLGRRWDGKLVMHYNLFRELVFLWASTYYSYRVALNTSSQAWNDGQQLAKMTQDMLNGSYLIGDMGNIPVITDPALIETINEETGLHTSTIYFVNYTANGVVTTYEEYFPLNTDYTAEGMLKRLAGDWSGKYQIVDDGRFMIHYKPPQNFCIQLTAHWQARLRVDTPFLCARIDNVSYTPDPFAVDETPFPQDSNYINGGTAGPLAGADVGTLSTIVSDADGGGAGIIIFTLNQALTCPNGTAVIAISGDGNTSVPGVISAGGGTATVTVNFTTGATPAVLQAITTASIQFDNGILKCNSF